MTLLVAADITLYKVGSKENVRKEFVIEARERIGDMYRTEHFGFAILNIVNLTDFIK